MIHLPTERVTSVWPASQNLAQKSQAAKNSKNFLELKNGTSSRKINYARDAWVVIHFIGAGRRKIVRWKVVPKNITRRFTIMKIQNPNLTPW